MNSTAKILIPDQEWLVTDNKQKIGSITKSEQGYNFHKNGKSLDFKDLADIKSQFGIAIFEESIRKIKPDSEPNEHKIYDYPCKTKPYNSVYSVKKKLPLFSKNLKSKSQYCAGYYVIEFRKGWVKGFCPKLITLERYPYQGPFKTEDEVKVLLNTLNKS